MNADDDIYQPEVMTIGPSYVELRAYGDDATGVQLAAAAPPWIFPPPHRRLELVRERPVDLSLN